MLLLFLVRLSLANDPALGRNSSDEWFPTVGVEQPYGQAWVDFYSTRQDSGAQEGIAGLA